MGVPFSTAVLDLTAVTSGTGKVKHLPVPGKGFLTRLAVQEEGETHDGFDVYLYDKATVYNEDGSAGADSDTEALHRVIAKQTVAAAGTLSFFFEASGVAYVNRDGSLSDNTRKLYVRVVPAGSGDKAYKISAGGTGVTA